MKTAKIVIDKNIGESDIYAKMFGMDDPCFSSDDMANFLKENSEAEQLDIEIRSDGGSVTHGFEIYDLLKNSGKKIKTIAYKANSIATVIFLAGHERVITKNAQFVIHNPFIDPSNLGYSGLTADDLFAIAEDIKKCEDKIFNLYNEVLNLDENNQIEVRNLMKADTDLTADNALKFGFATSIINGEGAKTVNLKNTAYTDKIAALVTNKNNNMDKKVLEVFDSLNNKIAKLWKAQNLDENGEPVASNVVNTTATADDGTVMYFTESAIAVGVMVFADEAMETPIADGTYSVSGQEVVISGGAVSTIETIEDAKKKMETLQNENESLKNELENLKAENAKIVNANTETIESLKDLKNEFENLKKVVPNDVKNLNTKPVELSAAQKQILKRKELLALGK